MIFWDDYGHSAVILPLSINLVELDLYTSKTSDTQATFLDLDLFKFNAKLMVQQ